VKTEKLCCRILKNTLNFHSNSELNCSTEFDKKAEKRKTELNAKITSDFHSAGKNKFRFRNVGRASLRNNKDLGIYSNSENINCGTKEIGMNYKADKKH